MQHEDRMHSLAARIDAGLDKIRQELGFEEIEVRKQHLLNHLEKRLREVSDD
jgi:hypothetical protein